jgi:hypothetical protein
VRILYYPGDNEASQNSLHKYITNELRKLNPKQWRQMDFFLYETQQGSEEDLVEKIREEEKKPWDKRKIAHLKEGLYEYRGGQSRLGTIRVYFTYNKETVFVVDAENKTSDHNKIERARARLREIFTSNKEQ